MGKGNMAFVAGFVISLILLLLARFIGAVGKFELPLIAIIFLIGIIVGLVMDAPKEYLYVAVATMLGIFLLYSVPSLVLGSGMSAYMKIFRTIFDAIFLFLGPVVAMIGLKLACTKMKS